MKIMNTVLVSMVLVLGLSAQASFTVTGPNLKVQEQVRTPDLREDQRISEFFGNVQLNMSAWRSWKITNTGDTDLEFKSMTLGGVMYNGSTDCPDILPAQKSCIIDIRFTPFSEGYHTGYLDVITVDDGNMYFDFWGYGVR